VKTTKQSPAREPLSSLYFNRLSLQTMLHARESLPEVDISKPVDHILLLTCLGARILVHALSERHTTVADFTLEESAQYLRDAAAEVDRLAVDLVREARKAREARDLENLRAEMLAERMAAGLARVLAPAA